MGNKTKIVRKLLCGHFYKEYRDQAIKKLPEFEFDDKKLKLLRKQDFMPIINSFLEAESQTTEGKLDILRTLFGSCSQLVKEATKRYKMNKIRKHLKQKGLELTTDEEHMVRDDETFVQFYNEKMELKEGEKFSGDEFMTAQDDLTPVVFYALAHAIAMSTDGLPVGPGDMPAMNKHVRTRQDQITAEWTEK